MLLPCRLLRIQELQRRACGGCREGDFHRATATGHRGNVHSQAGPQRRVRLAKRESDRFFRFRIPCAGNREIPLRRAQAIPTGSKGEGKKEAKSFSLSATYRVKMEVGYATIFLIELDSCHTADSPSGEVDIELEVLVLHGNEVEV